MSNLESIRREVDEVEAAMKNISASNDPQQQVHDSNEQLKIEQLLAVLFGIEEHPAKINIIKIINLFFKQAIFVYKIIEKNYNNDTQ